MFAELATIVSFLSIFQVKGLLIYVSSCTIHFICFHHRTQNISECYPLECKKNHIIERHFPPHTRTEDKSISWKVPPLILSYYFLTCRGLGENMPFPYLLTGVKPSYLMNIFVWAKAYCRCRKILAHYMLKNYSCHPSPLAMLPRADGVSHRPFIPALLTELRLVTFGDYNS